MCVLARGVCMCVSMCVCVLASYARGVCMSICVSRVCVWECVCV